MGIIFMLWSTLKRGKCSLLSYLFLSLFSTQVISELFNSAIDQ
jgi:hypothetical protein